jgi:SAM-dependent methyltransferase
MPTSTKSRPTDGGGGIGSSRLSTNGGANGRLTGERPQQGVTPDSLLALHEAGYRAVLERLEALAVGRAVDGRTDNGRTDDEAPHRVGHVRILDVGCGQGFESVRFLAPGRRVLGADYSGEAVATASARYGPDGLVVAQTDATRLGFAEGSFDAACSSHLIEHFTDPEPHVAELARVTADDGAVFVLTPNEPADFENPFHLHLFGRHELRSMLQRHFGDVWLGGVDAAPHVKADFAARRAKAGKLLRLDVFDLRHRIPHSWYVWAYTRLLPLAYKLVAKDDSGGSTGITADDWFVTEDLDDTTLVLFAVARKPRRSPQAPASSAAS